MDKVRIYNLLLTLSNLYPNYGWSGLARLLGFRVGFDGQNPSLAGSSFSGFLGHLKALRPAKAVVKIARNLIKFTIQLFVPPGVTFKEE